MKADCKFYDITDRLSVYALNPRKCPNVASNVSPNVSTNVSKTSKITKNVVRGVFNELEKNHINKTELPQPDKSTSMPQAPQVPHRDEFGLMKNETKRFLGNSYTITRPDYSGECKKVAIQNDVDCFDHYEVGYSDAFCQIQCNQIQTY